MMSWDMLYLGFLYKGMVKLLRRYERIGQQPTSGSIFMFPAFSSDSTPLKPWKLKKSSGKRGFAFGRNYRFSESGR